MKALSMAVAGLGMLSFTARSRVTNAGQAVLKGDVPKAADDAQRAYDLISGNANTAPQCLVGRL